MYNYVLCPKLMFAECDKHYPSRCGQAILATAITKFTKPVTKNNFGPSTIPIYKNKIKNQKNLAS